MNSLELLEIKLLLNFLKFDGYSAGFALKTLRPEKKTPLETLEKMVAKLAGAGYLEVVQVTHIEATEAGMTALQTKDVPLAAEEIKVLRACKKNKTRRIKSSNKEVLTLGDEIESKLRHLESRGLVKLTTGIERIKLTLQAQHFLCQQWQPQHPQAKISFQQLGYLVHLLRQHLGQTGQAVPDESVATETAVPPTHTQPTVSPQTVDADGLFSMIKALQAAQGDDNLVPLYKIRDEIHAQVAPPLDREQTDQLLYQLSREKRIELVTALEMGHFNENQIAAAIPQEVGGPIFYARVPA